MTDLEARDRAGRSKNVDLDGLIHYVDYGGDGPPVLLVHGLGGSHLNWMLVASRLTEQHRVVTIDLPGFGLSPPEQRSTHVEHQADVVGRFVNDVIGSPAYLMGNSMGGLVSLLAVDRHPQTVAGMVLVDAALPPAALRLPSADTLRFLGPPLLPGIGGRLIAWARNSRSVEEHVAATIDFIAADPSAVPREVHEAGHAMETARRAMPWSIPAFVDAQRSIASVLLRRRELLRAIHGIGAPVLIVHGAEDRVVPVESALWLADIRPDWQIAILDGVGHVPQLEAPDAFLDAVGPWLAAAITSTTPPGA
ncbi:MAG: alpha/beta hydrolase [Acidimicrobiia bacterium]|nr:alpha/beta hydrolase [Acidimicrobiia bacterium]